MSGILNELKILKIFHLKNISKFHFEAYHRYFCTVTQSINYLRSLLDNSICFSKFAKWAEQKDPLKSRDKIKRIFNILKKSVCVQIWVWWHERVNFFHPQEPNEDKSSRGSDKNALDTILSGPHQRITRYGLLLGPVVGKLVSDPKQIETAKKLKNLKKCADSLCRWMNGRVTLDHLHKGKKLNFFNYHIIWFIFILNFEIIY